VSAAPPEPVLAAWGAAGATSRTLGAGLINHTFLVEAPGGNFVLQRLHSIFAPEVNEDIDVVTGHLAARRVLTPRLLRTRSGALWHEHEGALWRALTWIDGIALERFEHAGQAREAGGVLGRFHVALRDIDHEFRHARAGVHDTARHLGHLRRALERHRDHPRFTAVAPLARSILEAADALPTLPATPERVVHGDPKASNVLFATGATRALCLIDLDTLSRMRLPLELGDAFRSWCNPAGEDAARASFSVEFFEAAVEGYAAAAGALPGPAERDVLVDATLTIYVELAARFCADALEECYFGWNAGRFASRSEHNEARAGSQLAAARALAAQRDAAAAVVRRAFA
jgi:Ser/Thr protein kinase RdoA (MazF antagonist)